jgi:hypothetical protein
MRSALSAKTKDTIPVTEQRVSIACMSKSGGIQPRGSSGTVAAASAAIASPASPAAATASELCGEDTYS